MSQILNVHMAVATICTLHVKVKRSYGSGHYLHLTRQSETVAVFQIILFVASCRFWDSCTNDIVVASLLRMLH